MEKQQDFKPETPATLEVKEQPVTLLEVQAWVPAEQVAGIMNTFDTNQDGVISAAEAKANDAHQSLFTVLTKLGANPDDLAIVLGIEPKAVREKRQADDKAERDRMRKDWEEGQKFDKDEREKIKPEPKKEEKTDPVAGWSASVVMKSSTELELTMNNGSKLKGIAYRRITDPKTNKVLSEGSRTVGAGLIEPQVYNRASGWPAGTIVVVRLNDPDSGPVIKLK